jgi:hypothetical protein
MKLNEDDDFVTKFNKHIIKGEINECFEKLMSSKSKNRFDIFFKRVDKNTSSYVRMQHFSCQSFIVRLYTETYTKLRSEYANQFSEDDLLRIPKVVWVGGQYFYAT